MGKTTKLEEFQKEQLDEIANALRSLRIENGYTNYDFLAYDLGISRSQYGAYENGQNMTLTTLMKIVNHYKMSLVDFFEYVKTTKAESK